MVLALAERLAVVIVDNVVLTYSIGYGVYYGVAVILPELIVSFVMLAVVVFSFAQSGSSGATSSGLKTNSTYNDSEGTEMPKKSAAARYDEYQ